MQGKIIKGIAGFYYVHVAGSGVYECKAKGIFRKENKKPLVGDNVEIDVLDEKDMEGSLVRILPRKNELIRPAVANVDQALVVFAAAKPDPHLNLLDRFLVMMERKEIRQCSVLIRRILPVTRGLRSWRIFIGTADAGSFSPVLRRKKHPAAAEMLEGKTTTVAGPSGVGKSSLINLLQSEIQMETGSISEKIERGRHTTRHSELIAIDENSYIMDTPGFSSLYTNDFEKEELKYCFPEFSPFEGQCRYNGCDHVHEPDCAVKEAVDRGEIHRARYDSYLEMYEELKA